MLYRSIDWIEEQTDQIARDGTADVPVDSNAGVTATNMADPSHHSRWLLRRGDQTAVAGLVVTALTLTAGWWLLHGGPQGHVVEIDRAEPLTARFEVDVNTADAPELMQLPGIGPKLAQRIIESRDDAGPFTSQADLRRVRGIGPKTLEKLRPFLRSIPDQP